MKDPKLKKGVLANYKREGKRLIPPFMRLTNIVETSFRDTKIPELLWISAVFNRSTNKAAVDGVIEFLIACQRVVSDQQMPHLAFLSHFNLLSDEHRRSILGDKDCLKRISFLKEQLWHQNALLRRYPLGFIFDEDSAANPTEAIRRIKEDVEGLLDRHSLHATKVQVTAVVSMMATGKMFIHKKIDFPDPNAIFTEPESAEARRVASLARAALNTEHDLTGQGEPERRWANDFWAQTFALEGCQ